MPKKNKITGSRYRIGCHPLKSSVNEWIANITRDVVHLNDDPWALLLESEATLTIKCLTCPTPSLTKNNTIYSEKTVSSDSFSDHLGPIINANNIVIPQPDLDQLRKIEDSYPNIPIFPLTSHELLSDLSKEESEDQGDSSFISMPEKDILISSTTNYKRGLSDNYVGLQKNIAKKCLKDRGWQGWFDLVWLDYCGKVSSGNAGKQRKLDLEILFSSGMLAGGISKLAKSNEASAKSNKSFLSVLAITMSNRATPLRYILD